MPTGNLPKEGADLHKKVYDEALKGKCKGDKECAAKMAWGAVHQAGWVKSGDKWVKKSDVVQEFSMYFSKVGTNTKKWSMTASDTLLDLRDEAMSLELYKSFTENIEADKPVPDPFSPIVTDSFWSGGMPYLSIAHYPALDGDGIPGDVHAVYVDGNQLKAKGIFNDTPLGLATWQAVLADKSGTSKFEDKTRVSIGFIDLSHRHGDFVFERKSLDDRCPMCDSGAGNKVYLKGYLVHLAMTRKPVNPRSEVEVDLSMTTRKEDAASIVGEELAADLSEKQKALIGLSDVIVERADDEPETVETADTVSEVEPEKVDDAPESVAEKSMDGGDMPMAGPTSMKAMMDAKAAKEELYHMQDLWYMAEDVIYNILGSPDITDKKTAIGQVLDEFKSALSTKSLIDLFSTSEKTVDIMVDKSAVDLKYDNLAEVMMAAMAEPITSDEKLLKIQPALNELAETIKEEVTKPETVEVTETQPAPALDVSEQINKAIQPLIDQFSLINARLTELSATPSAERRVPQPRSFSTSSLAVKPLVTKSEQRQLTPIEKIARESVGLNVD